MPIALAAQQTTLLLDNRLYNNLEGALYQKEAVFHTSMKPYLESEVRAVVNPDSVWGTRPPRLWGKLGKNGTFGKKLDNSMFQGHWLQLNKEDFTLTLNPGLDLGVGRDLPNSQGTWINTRSLNFSGTLGKKFSFYTSFYENQGRFVNYVTDFVNQQGVFPGFGRPKPFGTGGFDYGWANGYISYTPNKFFNVQAGHDKQFIGDGYRSLLLSDNAFNYPFLKLSAKVWRLKYSIIYAQFQDIQGITQPNVVYPRKNAVFHYLDILATKRFSVGLFESVIWQAQDTLGNTRGFDINYLNPFIFFRPVEFSLGSPDNVVLGLNLRYTLGKSHVLYGQIILDEFFTKEVFAGNGWWANKQGFQLGYKAYDLFGVKNLNIQTEYNWVRPYTYTHFLQRQSYGHYNQALAHPMGANFWDWNNFIRYRYKRFMLSGQITLAKFGTDGPTDNYGGDIFKDYTTRNNEYGNKVGQGIANNLLYVDGNVAYLINPTYGLRFEVGATARRLTTDGVSNSNLWFYVGLKTWLPNRYWDFR